MYPYRNNSYNMNSNSSNYQNYVYSNDGERFFWAPFVVGGLAGTALGYGIANNNQINRKQLWLITYRLLVHTYKRTKTLF